MNTKICILGIVAATTVSAGDAKQPKRTPSKIITSAPIALVRRDSAAQLPAPGDYISTPWRMIVRVPGLADSEMEMPPPSATAYSGRVIDPKCELTPLSLRR